MDQVDMVLVGAEGVMENGGIVNKTGTYQISIVARALNKPVYVAVESYKFARMYPLTQRDIYDLCATNDDDDDDVEEGDDGEGAKEQGEGEGEGTSSSIESRRDVTTPPPKSRSSSSLLSDMGGVLGSPDAGVPPPVHLQRTVSGDSDSFTVRRNNSSMLDMLHVTGSGTGTGSGPSSNRDSGKFNPESTGTGSGSGSGSGSNKHRSPHCIVGSSSPTSSSTSSGGGARQNGDNAADHNSNNRNSNSNSNSRDRERERERERENASSSPCVSCSHMLIDFTPAEYITLLFTDLGVLTPAAVSDELIRLYQ